MRQGPPFKTCPNCQADPTHWGISRKFNWTCLSCKTPVLRKEAGEPDAPREEPEWG